MRLFSIRWRWLMLTTSLAGWSFVGACGNDWAATVTLDDGDAGSDAQADVAAPIDDTPYCNNGQPSVAYPDRNVGAGLLQTLADTTFAGESGPVALHDLFEPCAEKSRLLVFRVSAGWCGTCRWHAAHTANAVPTDVAARIELIDLLIATDRNLPPGPEDLAAWKTHIDAPQTVALDPAFTFGAIPGAPMPLPLYVLVDSRTMTVRNYLNDPDPETLSLRIHQELAVLDHTSVPVGSPPKLYDGRFTQDRWDELHDMTMPGNPPPDPTNAHADDTLAAGLGQELFSDTSLSPSGTVSCATCHDPAKAFVDGKPVGVGVAVGDRNTPSVLFASYSPWQFWDGRADSLWAQALGPIENAKEMGSSRLFVAHALVATHSSSYSIVFGAPPDLSDPARFPANGKPGDPAWEGMTPADKTTVTTMVVNAAKALEAFERTLRALPNALDGYIGGDTNALSADQKQGLSAFFASGCAQCHWGPRLTDDAFHTVRFATGHPDASADRGRLDGVPLLLASELLETGAFSDSKTDTHGLALLSPPPATMLGAFKTPALRGVADTAPYGHGGTMATLADVTKVYSTAGLDPSDHAAVGVSEPWLPRFDMANQLEIPAFLQVLTAIPKP